MITKKFLLKICACREAIEYFDEKKLSLSASDWIRHLIKKDKLEWANWFIVRCMKYKQYVSYAVYAAEQVIHIYEKKYPDDKRPREAIEAAKRCIKNPSRKNKAASIASLGLLSSGYFFS